VGYLSSNGISVKKSENIFGTTANKFFQQEVYERKYNTKLYSFFTSKRLSFTKKSSQSPQIKQS